MADEPAGPPRPSLDSTREARTARFMFRAPTPAVSVVLTLASSGLFAALFWLPSPGLPTFVRGFLFVFALPALFAALLTVPLATAFGGKFAPARSFLLAVTSATIPLPVAAVWKLLAATDPSVLPPVAGVLLLLQGFVLWFRHMSLFGVSNPRHARTLPVSLLQPVLSIVGIFALYPPTVNLVVEAALYLSIGFLACALLLRAADRPLRREFQTSGVSLIRPLLDHINQRDPAATAILEGFFARFSLPADLRVTLVAFRQAGRTKATIALPTVHPGPFAALGASDLPRKLASRLGVDAGVVFVPHTPCNHDLDLPTGAEVERVASATRALLARLDRAAPAVASRLVDGGAGSLARAQLVGDVVLTVVTQAPAPTDDIDFSVVDPIVREYAARSGPRLAVIDAHNSYVEDQGDLTYGTPKADQLARDIRSAVDRAIAEARPGPVRVGVASKTGYSIREHGIGPEGIRALVVEAAGTKTAYVLIDGNNLVQGRREPILGALTGLVDTAEVMTTDNHIVHEVDGGINPVGERYPTGALIADVVAVVQAATRDLAATEVYSGVADVPDVPVLKPAWTARLLTSLGDTLSMFANAFLTTFLLVLTGSLVVLLALR